MNLITEEIRVAIDEGKYACGIFLDLQKAFDTVEHNILLKKLEYYGLRGIARNWLKSYLENRTQMVEVQGKKSNKLPVKHGVPQGSVLGPLLFLIYINDLHTAIKHSKVYHFADDTSILNIDYSLKKINKQCNHDLKLLCEWLRANKISLNTQKSEIIVFRSKQKTKINKTLNFRLSGQKMSLKKSVKYLGIHLDEHLSWDTHMAITLPKLNRAAGMLAKIRYYVSYDTLLNIYYAIFNSHLTYGSQSWGQGTSKIVNKFEEIQNKAIRIIHFKKRQDPYLPLYKQSKILKLTDLIKLNNCVLVSNHQNKKLPTAFKNFFVPINEFHSHTTRHSNCRLVVPGTKTVTYGTNSIKTQATNTWNDMLIRLKINLKECSKATLKKLIHTFLLQLYIK